MNSHTNKSREYHYDYSNQPFSCDMMTSPAAGNTEFHMHNRFELYYLLDGHVQYFVENVCYNMTPGSLILFSSNEIHKAINTTNTPFSRIVIQTVLYFPYQPADLFSPEARRRQSGLLI